MTAYAYYNEIDPYAAQWLRNLISAGIIAPGVVDERSIVDVQIEDIHGFTQCHWFAGIGIWSLALRKYGWADERPVWTGSAPCQPFSNAGKGKGTEDERHLWPAWFRLIKAANPPSIFGEQVASKAGRAWFDIVSASLESAAYTPGAANIAAASVGAPNIRQRLFFAAHNDHGIWYGAESILANASGQGLQRRGAERILQERRSPSRYSGSCGTISRMANTDGGGGGQGKSNIGKNIQRIAQHSGATSSESIVSQSGSTDARQTMWDGCDWLSCKDGKFRPVESGAFPLVDGVANRVGKLRAFGNCINLEATTEFIAAAETGRHDLLRFLMAA